MLRRCAWRVLVAFFLAADIGLVGLDDLAFAAHRAQVAFAHGFADTVGHEPSRLVGDAEHAVQLVRAHALLGRAHADGRPAATCAAGLGALKTVPTVTVNCLRHELQ